ncbi:S-formylglutathione hydrolase FrmB [Nocardia kruczakiae]|uniref:S-formylglutathione hydrolase FrmB n=2 Tax=Nocardia TaxID=1817 RepID=A0ABU1XAC3_9NOCA|nr:alpha/beta hydrolase family protein [Nocardia kruczakiae]MDR7167481.1 S-formylglutathione hydrolase FrmB [Nocardia kruczakiae]
MITRAALGAALAVAAGAMAAAPVCADPAAPPPAAPPAIDPAVTRTELVRTETRKPGWDRLYVASAAMHRVVPIDVLHGGGSEPRPTLYLLDGVEGAATSGWLTDGEAARFFAGKPVDVVLPGDGVGSMYADWDHYDQNLGLNRWETFLVDELPPIVEKYLHSDGRRAIAGVSMGAQAAMMLAQRHPGFYRAVAGISGCYSTADEVGQAVTRITVASRGGNPENLWGPPNSPEWAAHDSYLGADTLRGTPIYLSAATGLPSPPDLTAIATAHDVAGALRSAGGGIALEAGARTCTERFAARLAQLNIPATVRYIPAGTHSWPDFTAALPSAWDALAAGLGIARTWGPR